MSDLEPITQEETAWANGDLEPITRKEQYLNRLTGEEQDIPDEPVTRTEQYLARLCGEETEIPSSPITREEAYLAYLNGEDVALPEPITRLEQFMAYAASKSETKPTPLTREEFYWDKYQGGAVLKDFPGLPASIVTVTDALAKPLDSLKVAITPVQSGSGDPSPDNIRPISGWTGCNVSVTGANVWDEEWGASGSSGIKAKNKLSVKPSTEYYFKSPCRATFYRYDKDGNFFGSSFSVSANSKFTTTDEQYYVRFDTGAYYGSTTYNNDISINYPATDTSYHAYTGQDYPITFPSEAGTVYGGTLDVTNGTLTVTDVIKTLSGDASEEWSALSVEGAFFLENCFVGAPSDMKTSANSPVCLCNMYKESSSISNSSSMVEKANNVFCNQGRGEYYKRLFIKDTRFTDVNDFTQMLSIQNLKVVYPLATPVTYQLTPTEVQMLLGTNNIWADTGDILEGKYWSKNPVTVTRAMLNTLRDAGEIAEITPEEPEEPEENADER